MTSSATFLGIDFGTSGARAIIIDSQGQIQAQANVSLTQQTATCWQISLFHLIQQLPVELRQALRSIAINGTSSTVLLCDGTGQPLDDPILYNDDRGAAVIDQLKAIAPANLTVISATSSLAKLLWWMKHQGEAKARSYFLHQADWLGFLLHNQLGISDYHNALKLGYDVEHLCYPEWLQALPLPFRLPEVTAPGHPIAPIQSSLAAQFDIPSDCLICAGTTDSIAAFLASGASELGEAVTSLGSTLVLKLLSKTRIEDARYGIYSHRLGDLWLVGGASNTGGTVLKQFFSDADLQRLSLQIQPNQPSSFDYYPLLKPGERFPINDPTLAPRLEPRPDHPADFLHGLLESIARIEAQGYQLLQQLGADSLRQVYTAGGGAQNSVWATIRSRYLRVPVLASIHTEAAYGTALLAQRGSQTGGSQGQRIGSPP
jgi:D-ribulokinase